MRRVGLPALILCTCLLVIWPSHCFASSNRRHPPLALPSITPHIYTPITRTLKRTGAPRRVELAQGRLRIDPYRGRRQHAPSIPKASESQQYNPSTSHTQTPTLKTSTAVVKASSSCRATIFRRSASLSPVVVLAPAPAAAVPSAAAGAFFSDPPPCASSIASQPRT